MVGGLVPAIVRRLALLAAVLIAIGALSWLFLRERQVSLQMPAPIPAPAPAPAPDPAVPRRDPNQGFAGLHSPKVPNPTVLSTDLAAPAEVMRAVGQILERLVQGTIAYNVPENMRLGHTQAIQAALGANITLDEVIRAINAPGQVDTTNLKLAPQMQVTLLGGSAFDVSPSGPQLQLVASDAVTQWQWQVTPKAEGQQELMLVVDALIEVAGQKGTHTVSTLKKAILVEVGWPETPREWSEWLKKWVEYGGWLWTAFFVPAGGIAVWLWTRIGRRKSAKPHEPGRDRKSLDRLEGG